MINIGTSDVISEIEEGTCVLSSNNYNAEQWDTNQKSDSNSMLCGNINEGDNIKSSACLIEGALAIDKNSNILVATSNSLINGKKYYVTIYRDRST